jgi:hypothetical protein
MPAMLAATAQQRPDPAVGRVPVEFVGRARLLRDRIAEPAIDWAVGSVDLLAPFAGANSSPMSRRTLLSRLPASWRALPDVGRLGLGIHRGAPLTIFEARCIPYAVGRDGWSGDELSVAVVVRRVEVRLRPQPEVSDVAPIVAVVGLHGLARRYERGSDATDGAVLRDLAALTDRRRWRTGMRDSRSEFDVPVADGGCWRGAATMLDDKPVLAVRTFVA